MKFEDKILITIPFIIIMLLIYVCNKKHKSQYKSENSENFHDFTSFESRHPDHYKYVTSEFEHIDNRLNDIESRLW